MAPEQRYGNHNAAEVQPFFNPSEPLHANVTYHIELGDDGVWYFVGDDGHRPRVTPQPSLPGNVHAAAVAPNRHERRAAARRGKR